ncbi:MAG: hypothetical protein AAF628_11780 [Planctomycetota bacterium]
MNASRLLLAATLAASPLTSQGHLYFVGNAPGPDVIRRTNLDGSGVQAVVTGLMFPQDVAVDAVGGKLYWTDLDQVQRANLDGTQREVLVSTGGATRGVAIDSAGGKVYWTDSFNNTVQRANLDGTNVEDLATVGVNAPANLALDVAGGKLYWVEQNDRELLRANLDGTGVEVLDTDASWGVVLDLVERKLYWGRRGSVIRADLDGGNPTLIQTLRGFTAGMALDPRAGKLYVVEGGPSQIERMNLDGSGLELILPFLSTPLGIDLDVSGCGPAVPAATLDYGCGVNPADSLTVLRGVPRLGADLRLGVDNPLGTQPAGSVAFLAIAERADPRFPCGTLVPGFGMAGPGAVGELLFDPSAAFAVELGEGWSGAGNPSPFRLSIPDVCTLLGGEVFVQGGLVDATPGAPVRFGLTTGLQVRVGR